MIIGNMLFNIDGEKTIPTYEWTLSIFKLFKDANNNHIKLGRE